MQEFQIDYLEMKRCIEKTKDNSNCEFSETTSTKDEIQQLCLEHQYNYEIVKYALKLYPFYKGNTLEQLIDKAIQSYNCKEQKEIASWIYETYGTIISDLLLSIGINPKPVLRNMTNHVISIEEATQHEIFQTCKGEKNNFWIEILYKHIIEKVKVKGNTKEVVNNLAIASQEIARDCQLTKEELEILANALSKYLKVTHLYQVADVGLETDDVVKEEKIRKYKFQKENIEESVLFTLRFDKERLLNAKSELYQKRKRLSSYITEWNCYTKDDKLEIKEMNGFSEEEINYIENKNNETRVLLKKKNKE